MTSEEIQEQLEYNRALQDMNAVLATNSGIRLFKYLLKEFEYGQLPPIGLEGPMLHDKLGSLRAGKAIFEILSSADPLKAGSIMASIEKERNEKVHRDQIANES